MLTTFYGKVPFGQNASCQTNVVQTWVPWLHLNNRLSSKNGWSKSNCSGRLLVNKCKKNKRTLKCSLKVLKSQLNQSLKISSTWRRRTCSPVAAVAVVPENALMTSRCTCNAQRDLCPETCTGLRTSVAATSSSMSSSAKESPEKWDNTINKSTKTSTRPPEPLKPPVMKQNIERIAISIYYRIIDWIFLQNRT